MDNKTIVTCVRKLEPAEGPAGEGAMKAAAGSLTVYFDDDETARLDREDPLFEVRAATLEELREAAAPVYVEVEGESRKITAVRIPFSGRVRSLFRDRSGAIVFQLDNSAQPFRFTPDHPRYADYLRELQEAQLDRIPILVTVTEKERSVVDIRRAANPEPPAPMSIAEFAPATLPTRLRTVDSARARELFEKVSAPDCGAAPGSPCIPYLYPDNGCHARAHEMCRLIAEEGEQPLKVWNYSRDADHPLAVATSNSPDCEVVWSFHVAAVLLTKEPGEEEIQATVLDPSLFPEGPVPLDRWRRTQGDSRSCLLFTAPAPFLPPASGLVEEDRSFRETRRELARYRRLLAERVSKFGEPPYACE